MWGSWIGVLERRYVGLCVGDTSSPLLGVLGVWMSVGGKIGEDLYVEVGDHVQIDSGEIITTGTVPEQLNTDQNRSLRCTLRRVVKTHGSFR